MHTFLKIAASVVLSFVAFKGISALGDKKFIDLADPTYGLSAAPIEKHANIDMRRIDSILGKALDEANKTRLPIFIPAGKYIFGHTQELNGLTVFGPNSAGDAVLWYDGDHPAFSLTGQATIKNLSLKYHEEGQKDGDEPKRDNSAIDITSGSNTVDGVLISDFPKGITALGETGSLKIVNVQITSCWIWGLKVERSRNFSRIEEVRIHTDPKITKWKPIAGIWLVNCDATPIVNCTVLGTKTGFHIGDSDVRLDNCLTDTVGEAIRCEHGDNNPVVVNNGDYRANSVGVVISENDNSQYVSIIGGKFRVANRNGIEVRGGRKLSVKATTITAKDKAFEKFSSSHCEIEESGNVFNRSVE